MSWDDLEQWLSDLGFTLDDEAADNMVLDVDPDVDPEGDPWGGLELGIVGLTDDQRRWLTSLPPAVHDDDVADDHEGASEPK